MKYALVLCLIACFYGIYAEDEMRLIRFNETYAKWMTTKEVDELVTECAAKNGHTGFMDVTVSDHEIYPQREVTIPVGPTHQAEVRALNARLSGARIWSTITSLSDYNTRYYTQTTGLDAVDWLEEQYKTIAGSRLGQDITIERFEHSWLQPSLIVRIRGTKFPAERVIIGGHIDSTAGSGGSSRAPGADDDASGSSTVLEAFRILVTDPNGFKPDRTLEFQAYAAEEVGLRGSQAIAEDYYANGFNVIGMLQLDMTGYDGSGVIGIVTDYTNPVLTQFLRACAGAYCTTPVASTACNYGCSDHASFYRVGYPASFAFESRFTNSNPDIHTNRDTLDKLQQDHAVQFGYLAVGFLVELSYEEKAAETIAI